MPIDFLCAENDQSNNVIKLQLPDVCCGIKIELLSEVHLAHGGSLFLTSCDDHMYTYSQILKNFGPGGPLEIKQSQSCSHEEAVNKIRKILADARRKNGCNCIKCGMQNQYAIPNTDKGYVCFECRT